MRHTSYAIATASTAASAQTAKRLGVTSTSGVGHLLFEHENATLPAPVHSFLEVGTGPASFEHEHEPQHVLVEQRDVRGIDVELRREIEQAGRLRMEARGHVDEL